MKKFLLPMIVCAFVLGFASCKNGSKDAKAAQENSLENKAKSFAKEVSEAPDFAAAFEVSKKIEDYKKGLKEDEKNIFDSIYNRELKNLLEQPQSEKMEEAQPAMEDVPAMEAEPEFDDEPAMDDEPEFDDEPEADDESNWDD